jgi:hypothetical protein
MKRVLQLIVFALAIQITMSAQVIPNGSFEEWESNSFGILDPVDWIAPLNLLGIESVSRVEGYNGGYAAKLNALEVPGSGVATPILSCFEFPVTEKYATLTGKLKCNLEGNDTLFIVANFYVIDGEDEIDVGVGFGIFTQNYTEFTNFDINILYFEEMVPEYGLILITAGQLEEEEATLGTSIVIDELDLAGSASVSEISPVFGAIGNVYPNPASGQINIPFELKEPENISITITDLTGRIVYQKMNTYFAQGVNEVNVDISNLSPGTYFYSVIPSDGRSIIKKFIVR